MKRRNGEESFCGLLQENIYSKYICGMTIEWNPEKNAALKARYGFGFERVLVALSEGALVERRAHPSRTRYAHQQQLLVLIDDYIWVVPFVEQDGGIFLKTMFPSRKATRIFMRKKS